MENFQRNFQQQQMQWEQMEDINMTCVQEDPMNSFSSLETLTGSSVTECFGAVELPSLPLPQYHTEDSAVPFLQLGTASPQPKKTEEFERAPSGKYASPSDWDGVRHLVKRFYADEGNTLRDTMIIMEQDYGHRATPKMYKDRIKKWGFDKKIKEAEAFAILRKQRQRDAIRKDSAFSVRGKTVTVDEVLRYFKRKGIIAPEDESQTSCPRTPPALKCYTPPPSLPFVGAIPAAEDEDSQVNKKRILQHEAGKQSSIQLVSYASGNCLISGTSAFPPLRNHERNSSLNLHEFRYLLSTSPGISSYDIPQSPLPPQSLVASEKLFVGIRNYFIGGIESGLFITDEVGYFVNANSMDGQKTLSDFSYLYVTAFELMESKLFAKGRRCLSKAWDLVGHIVREQAPESLFMFLRILLKSKLIGFPEIASSFCTLVRKFAAMLLPEGHPWREILCNIEILNENESRVSFIEALRCAVDTVVNSLGQFHRVSIMWYHEFQKKFQELDKIPKLMYNLVTKAEEELGGSDVRVLDLKLAYGEALFNADQESEAIAILDDLIERCRDIGTCRTRSLEVRSLQLSAKCYYYIGRNRKALRALRRAIAEAEELFGNHNVVTLSLKVKIEEWLREFGLDAEAVEVGEEVEAIIGPDDLDFTCLDFEAE